MHKFSKPFVQAIHNTWQAIGPDILQCYEETGGEADNEEVVESCIDADRIVMYGGEGGKAAQDEFRARSAVVGYGVALREAVKSLPYPLV
jgi:hypothetical protein